MPSCTRIRFAVTQVCPELRNLARMQASTAVSIFASSKTMKGLLPPNSRESFVKLFAHCFASSFPTRVDPVKLNLRTALDLQRASPTSATLSRVVITLIVPLGKPACSASTAWARALSGVSPAGFQTVVHPAANAAPTFLEIIYTRTVSIPNHFRREALHTAAGKFHGAKQAATPSGCLIVTIR
jgi:hypothetical protein